MIAQMDVQINLTLKVQVLKLVDRANLKFADDNRKRSSRFSDIRPIGPKVKTKYFRYLYKGSIPLWVSSRSSIGRAEH